MVIVLQDSSFASVMRRSLCGSQENIEVFKAAPGCAVLGLRLHNGRTLDFCRQGIVTILHSSSTYGIMSYGYSIELRSRATTSNHVYQILLCGLGRQKLASQGYVWTLSVSLRLSWHCGRASPNSGWVGIEACLNPEERWQRVMTAMRAPESNWIEMSSGEGARSASFCQDCDLGRCGQFIGWQMEVAMMRFKVETL